MASGALVPAFDEQHPKIWDAPIYFAAIERDGDGCY